MLNICNGIRLLPGGATTIRLCAKTRRSRGTRGSTTAHIWMKTKNIDKCSNNNLVQLFIISRFWLIVDFTCLVTLSMSLTCQRA